MALARHLGLPRSPLGLRLVVISVVGGLISVPVAGQGNTGSDPLGRAAAFALQDRLSFRLSAGYLIEVEGRIGTQGGLKFLLDTGSTISIIDNHIADKIKLQRHRAESLSFDRKLAWELTTVPDVQFGPIKAQNVRMLVGRLAQYSDFAKNVQAIIGLDLLTLSNLSIDYGEKKIIFHSPRREYTPTSGEPLSACVFLVLQVQGGPVNLLVDTGFPGLLLYEERLLKRIQPLTTIGGSTGVTIGGRLHARQAVLSNVVFGARTREVSVLLLKGTPPNAFPGIDGIVGLAPLKARRVHFDFVRKTLSWE